MEERSLLGLTPVTVTVRGTTLQPSILSLSEGSGGGEGRDGVGIWESLYLYFGLFGIIFVTLFEINYFGLYNNF